MNRTTTLAAGCLTLLVAVGCGSMSRYNEGQFGPVIDTPMEPALANIDGMMKDPQGTMQAGMKKQQEAVAQGKELFNDPKTGHGGKGLSCNSCHPNGGTTGGEVKIPMRDYMMPIPALARAGATFPKYKIPNNTLISLQQMDNNCIRMFMGGKRLPLDSPESYALAAYVASFSAGEPVNVGQTQQQ